MHASYELSKRENTKGDKRKLYNAPNVSCFESNEGSQSLKIYYMLKFFEDYSRGFLVSKMFGEGILALHKRTLEKGSWNQRLWVLQQFNMLQLSASDDPFAKTILILLVHNWESLLSLSLYRSDEWPWHFILAEHWTVSKSKPYTALQIYGERSVFCSLQVNCFLLWILLINCSNLLLSWRNCFYLLLGFVPIGTGYFPIHSSAYNLTSW